MHTGKTFVIGDIHGAHKALIQCLERSSFDKKNDLLICLGDVSDGWPETRQCLDELMTLENLVYILGNHDTWTIQWMLSGEIPDAWILNGGQATVDSFEEVSERYKNFFIEAHDYYLIENKLFVHAGILLNLPLGDQARETFFWDRSLFNEAISQKSSEREVNLTTFEEIYIGHTPIHRFGYFHPAKACEVWMMDTGAGWDGVLSIMDIHSKKFHTSDPIPDLYPGVTGRKIR